MIDFEEWGQIHFWELIDVLKGRDIVGVVVEPAKWAIDIIRKVHHQYVAISLEVLAQGGLHDGGVIEVSDVALKYQILVELVGDIDRDMR